MNVEKMRAARDRRRRETDPWHGWVEIGWTTQDQVFGKDFRPAQFDYQPSSLALHWATDMLGVDHEKGRHFPSFMTKPKRRL